MLNNIRHNKNQTITRMFLFSSVFVCLLFLLFPFLVGGVFGYLRDAFRYHCVALKKKVLFEQARLVRTRSCSNLVHGPCSGLVQTSLFVCLVRVLVHNIEQYIMYGKIKLVHELVRRLRRTRLARRSKEEIGNCVTLVRRPCSPCSQGSKREF